MCGQSSQLWIEIRKQCGTQVVFMYIHTIEPGLPKIAIADDACYRRQSFLQLLTLLQRPVAILQSTLQLLVGLLAFELPNAPLEALDRVLRPLAYGTLRFTIICPLLGQLLRRQVRHSSRARLASLALAAI